MIGPTYKEVLSKSENLTVILENTEIAMVKQEKDGRCYGVKKKFLMNTGRDIHSY